MALKLSDSSQRKTIVTSHPSGDSSASSRLIFPVVYDEKGFGESLVKAMKGQSVLPQTLIIGEDGRILKHFQGYHPTNMPVLIREVLDQAQRQTNRLEHFI